MAMATYLQMVSAEEIASLRATPASINTLNKPDKESCTTHFACSICYFLAGDAYPDPEETPFGGMLSGFETVDCSTLENGSFGLVSPAEVGGVLNALEKVDLKKVQKKVAKADADELAEEEVDDFETLAESEDPAGELVAAVESLLVFYRSAAKKKCGVVTYTT